MKKIYLLFAFVFTTFIYSQTTLEEYNYMLSGYHIQKSNGLDLKNGYEFEEVLNETLNGINYNIVAMSKTNKSFVGLIVTISAKDEQFYYAVPVENSDLFLKYYQELQELKTVNNQILIDYNYLTSTILASVFYNIKN
ncbi:MAG: hypothetical protein IE891_07750 [Flavobacteriaceae bacterium]|nr:hypothetical protein [Flavobacteriaceae bacterium]